MRNKLLIKAAAAAMAVVLALGLGACVRQSDEIDYDKTQLYVGVYDGGYGRKWAQELKTRFEEYYKDYSFTEDKVGAEIIYDFNADIYVSNNLIPKLEAGIIEQEVIFMGGDNLNGLNMQKYAYNLSDIVSKKLTKYGESKSIAEKVPGLVANHYKAGGEYYTLPSFSTSLGVVYDKQLFDNRSFYFKEGGGWTNLAGNRAAGPDGVKGNDDDGLPATYEDFFELCGYMKDKGVTPIAWTGKYSTAYMAFLLRALWADYEGVERASLEFNDGGYDPNAKLDLIKLDANGKIIMENGQPVIDKNVLYSSRLYTDLAAQPGRYYAIKFIEEIISNDYYDKLSIDTTQTHVMAQADFLESSLKGKPIAMLIEGTWWENEAVSAGTYRDLEEEWGKPARIENRDFGFMALPKHKDKVGTERVIYSEITANFINNKVSEDKAELAETFFQFMYTDESLRQLTRGSGAPLSMDYKLQPSDYQGLGKFTANFLSTVMESNRLYRSVYNTETQVRIQKYYYPFNFMYTLLEGETTHRTSITSTMVFDNKSALEIFEGHIKYVKGIT